MTTDLDALRATVHENIAYAMTEATGGPITDVRSWTAWADSEKAIMEAIEEHYKSIILSAQVQAVRDYQDEASR